MQIRGHDRCHVFLDVEYDWRVQKAVLPAYLNVVKSVDGWICGFWVDGKNERGEEQEEGGGGGGRGRGRDYGCKLEKRYMDMFTLTLFRIMLSSL